LSLSLLHMQGSGAVSHWDGEISGACMAVNEISQVSKSTHASKRARGARDRVRAGAKKVRWIVSHAFAHRFNMYVPCDADDNKTSTEKKTRTTVASFLRFISALFCGPSAGGCVVWTIPEHNLFIDFFTFFFFFSLCLESDMCVFVHSHRHTHTNMHIYTHTHRCTHTHTRTYAQT